MPQRRSPLDASFLAVESEEAHMHVGWVASFDPPAGRRCPEFADVLAHVAARLQRAPRYRQRLAPVPFRLGEPAGVGDGGFDLSRQVRPARTKKLPPPADPRPAAPVSP